MFRRRDSASAPVAFACATRTRASQAAAEASSGMLATRPSATIAASSSRCESRFRSIAAIAASRDSGRGAVGAGGVDFASPSPQPPKSVAVQRHASARRCRRDRADPAGTIPRDAFESFIVFGFVL